METKSIKVFGIPLYSVTTKSQTLNINEAIRYILDERDPSSININEGNAYKRHVWIHAAIKKRAYNISRVPFKIYRIAGKELSLVDENHPAQKLFNTVNDLLSADQLWEGTETYKLFRGETFWHIIREGNIIIGFEFLEPSLMRQVIDQDTGELIGWKYNSRFEGQVPLDLDEIIHFKFFNPYNDYRGLSPIAALKYTIQTDDEARKFNRSILLNGVAPGGVIESEKEMNDEHVERFKKQLADRNSGASNAGKALILWGGMKYKELRLSQDDAAYIEQRKLGKEEVLAVYDVPPAMVGDTAAFNRANMEDIKKSFWNEVLIPEMTSFEKNLKTNFFDKFFPGFIGLFDFKSIPELQDDINKQIDTAKKLNEMGFTANEINERFDWGFEDRPWRDQWWISFNVVPAGSEPIEPPQDTTGKIQKFLDNINKIEDEEKKRRYMIWKRLITKTGPIEREYKKKLSAFFFNLRKEVLNNFFDQAGARSVKQGEQMVLFNHSEQFKKLIDTSKPYISEAIVVGGETALADVGISTSFDIVNQPTIDFLNQQTLFLESIIDTVEENLTNIISDGVKEGLTNAEIADNIKHTMNVTSNRSAMIARTEITSAANGGRSLALKENGIEEHSWLNSQDTDVREEHMFSETVKIGEEFQNGLKFPGDKTGSGSYASNVVNCRCTTIGKV